MTAELTTKSTPELITDIARVCHEANRAWCASQGDSSQLPWEEAPEWQKESCIDGVMFHLEHPDAGPSGSHENWSQLKIKDGWVYGPVKNPDAKTHPCLVPYGDLPADQRVKDHIFTAIVRTIDQFFNGDQP